MQRRQVQGLVVLDIAAVSQLVVNHLLAEYGRRYLLLGVNLYNILELLELLGVRV